MALTLRIVGSLGESLANRKLDPADYFRVARDTGAIANAPKTILPRNPPGFRLLQAKFFSRRHQCDRFANAPLARFRSFSRMNPNDEVTSVGGRQRSEEHTSELQSRLHLVCRLLLEKKKTPRHRHSTM